MSYALRAITPDDTTACIGIYLDAVHNGTAPHYSEAERQAWAPPDTAHDPSEWTGRLGAGTGFLAVGPAGPAGFIVVTDNGHLDLFFVRPAARADGVAGALYERAVAAARARGGDRLTTHASRLARRFLEKRGWQLVAREVVDRNGVAMERFEMALEAPEGR